MTLVAGVDVGNSTTEIVIAEGATPIAWDHLPTRGPKGSVASGSGAARLLKRMESRLGRKVDVAVLTPAGPVHTVCARADTDEVDTGRLVVVARGAPSPGGAGFGVGTPIDIGVDPYPVGQPIVLVARDRLAYRDTVDRFRAWRASGSDIRGIVLAGDEGRLVAGRIDEPLPVMDCVDPDAALACATLAIEVAPSGSVLAQVSDPLRLAASLGLDLSEHADAAGIAAAVRGVRSAVIGLLKEVPHRSEMSGAAWVESRNGQRAPLQQGPRWATTMGAIRRWRAPSGTITDVDDLWPVDLGDVGAIPGVRPAAIELHAMVIAALNSGSEGVEHIEAFAHAWGGRVEVGPTEPEAGRLGALSSPGVSPEALVMDLGGGTLDLSTDRARTSLAGCGQLLTAAVAELLAISPGTAEWAKRGPARHVETPQVVVEEDGVREFVDPPMPIGSVGWLVCSGPGALPFTRSVSVTEWRALRLAVKEAVIGNNARRAIATLQTSADELIFVGGPAGDDELVTSLARALPGVVAGRADVAGRLGHRWAVAWGLVLSTVTG